MTKLKGANVTAEETTQVLFKEIEETPITAVSKDNGQTWQAGFAGGLITPKKYDTLEELKTDINKIDWWMIYSFVVAIMKTKQQLFKNVDNE